MFAVFVVVVLSLLFVDASDDFLVDEFRFKCVLLISTNFRQSSNKIFLKVFDHQMKHVSPYPLDSSTN